MGEAEAAPKFVAEIEACHFPGLSQKLTAIRKRHLTHVDTRSDSRFSENSSSSAGGKRWLLLPGSCSIKFHVSCLDHSKKLAKVHSIPLRSRWHVYNYILFRLVKYYDLSIAFLDCWSIPL